MEPSHIDVLGAQQTQDPGTEQKEAAVEETRARICRNGDRSLETNLSFSVLYLPSLFVNDLVSSIINALFQLKL